MMRNMQIICICLCLCFTASVTAQQLITIKPTMPYNVSSPNDIANLKTLATGVGWEFEANDETNARLKKIGMKYIRCINVEPLPGTFDVNSQFKIDTKMHTRLDDHLDTCRKIGAIPHIILATELPPDLVVQAKDVDTKDERVLGLLRNRTFGPNNWPKFRNYIKAYFAHVLITRGFPTARFEVANEPDVGGGIVPAPPRPMMGSRALYEAYLTLYSNVAQAAAEFEAEHAGFHVTLGGPTTTWAYTFTFGELNWMEHFLKDCGKSKIKLDFIGFHYYGNISGMTVSDPPRIYPSFSEMMGKTRKWRDLYTPGVPLYITEWGTSYCCGLEPGALHNGSNVGAAWSAAFLKQMLIEGVDQAIYLVTTDNRAQKDGNFINIWGWPSLFTNYTAMGTFPKAPYHVFQMVNDLAPNRVESTNMGTFDNIASADDNGRLTVMIWNLTHTIPESGAGVETGSRDPIILRIIDANSFFKSQSVSVKRYLISRTNSNALYLFETGQKIDERAELQLVDQGTFRIIDDALDIGFAQPPSSVSFIELTPSQVINIPGHDSYSEPNSRSDSNE